MVTRLPADGGLFHAVLLDLASSLVFFTLCLAHSNRSTGRSDVPVGPSKQARQCTT